MIAELLGEAFGGTLVSDFYAVYDQFDCPQQKVPDASAAGAAGGGPEAPGPGGARVLRRLQGGRPGMLRLKKQQGRLKAGRLPADRSRAWRRGCGTWGGKDWNDADADRLAGRLRKYQDRLTMFLHDPEVDGTNNAAERALRPAVVMRKITGGSRSEKGAQAWAILASVMRTTQQQGLPLVETIQTLLRGAWAGKPVVLLTDLFDTS